MQKARNNRTYLKLICFKTLWLCSIFRCCVMAVVTEVDLFYVSICSGHVAQGLWRSKIYIYIYRYFFFCQFLHTTSPCLRTAVAIRALAENRNLKMN